MNQSRSEVNQQQIGWRMDKVLDLSSKGHTEREIAQTLKVSQATVHRDLVILRQQAKENIRSYIDEQLPAEYQKCLVGIAAIMKEAWNTAATATADTTADRRDKLQALALAKECYAMKLDLLSSATVVERAVQFVDRNRGLMPQNDKVRIDVTAKESLKNQNGVTESG